MPNRTMISAIAVAVLWGTSNGLTRADEDAIKIDKPVATENEATSEEAVADKKLKKNKRKADVGNETARAKQRFKKMFNRRDKDSDGYLTSSEFAAIQAKKIADDARLAKRTKALKRQFKKLDKDGDRRLSEREFVAAMNQKRRAKDAANDQKKNARKRDAQKDVNKNGNVKKGDSKDKKQNNKKDRAKKKNEADDA